MSAYKSTPKRCTFELPVDLYDALADVAGQHNTSVVEMLRKYIKLGLLASEPGTMVLLRKNGQDQPVILLM
ncbi:MAG: hypothetical protein WHV44_07245 [Anaerolineales bacterium]